MKYIGNEDLLKYHQKRREELRTMSGSFQPSHDEIEKERQRFLNNGGIIKKLVISKDSIPNVWGDFVKSRIRAH